MKMNQPPQDVNRCAIGRLPTELLAELFVLSIPEVPYPSGFEPPLLLTAVCHTWRQVAHSTPQLWAKIGLDIPDYPCPYASRHFLERWISRSGLCLLSITLKLSRFSANESASDSPLAGIVNVVITYRHRWRALNIHLPAKYAQAILACNSPNLVHLEIISVEDTTLTLDLSSFPKINRLHLKQERVRLCDGITFPVHNFLRIADFGMPGRLEDCLRFLRHVPLLEHFSVRFRGTSPFQTSSPSSICHLNNLRYLNILAEPSSMTHFDLGKFMCHLRLPSLTSLYITNSSQRVNNTISHVARLITGSKSPLERFSYRGHYSGDNYPDFLQFFRSAPGIKFLSLSQNAMWALSALDPTNCGKLLLPVLEELCVVVDLFGSGHGSNIDGTVIHSLIISRSMMPGRTDNSCFRRLIFPKWSIGLRDVGQWLARSKDVSTIIFSGFEIVYLGGKELETLFLPPSVTG